MRKAKIVCTIGPATDSAALLERLIEAGMDAARLNFSHGSHDSHGRAIKAIRDAADRQHAAVAIILDLQGPRIRVGPLPGGGIEVENDQQLRLQVGPLPGEIPDTVTIPVTYANLTRDVKAGARILIDDGSIELVAKDVAEGWVECTVVTGGRIGSNKGINLPGTSISAHTLTDKDREDIRFGIAQGVDYLALSFVRGPEDVAQAKQLVAEFGGDVPLIAKIERPEAVSALDGLLEEADGIMIARGDLGVEMGPEAVPILQKKNHPGSESPPPSGDYRDPDARVHDPEPAPHQGGGLGCRQRGVRWHGRRDALRGNRRRKVSRGGRAGHGSDYPSRGGRNRAGRASASGASPHARGLPGGHLRRRLGGRGGDPGQFDHHLYRVRRDRYVARQATARGPHHRLYAV